MKAEADRADQAGAADTGRNSVAATTRAEVDMATRSRTKAEVATTSLMEAVVDRSNLMLAYQRVLENKGAAGVDQLAVSALKEHLKLQRSLPEPFGIDDGINHNIFQGMDGHPMQGEFHCWLYHCLYDHTDLWFNDMLRIGHIWVELQVLYQHRCAVAG